MENTPIISPWFFYFVQFLERINIALTIVLIIAIVALVAVAIVILVCYLDGYDSSFEEYCKDDSFVIKIFKKNIAVVIVFTILMIFMPSKKTIVSMVVAKNITPQNIENAKDIVKAGVDYVFEKINLLKGEDN